MSEVSIANLMIPKKEVTLDFPDCEGMTVTLCYNARSELVKLRKSCVTTKFNRKTHQPEEVLNEEKFLDKYANAVVKGWNGFKIKHLSELLLVDLGDQDPEASVPFTQDNLLMLMRNSSFFDSWVSEECANLENFTKRK